LIRAIAHRGRHCGMVETAPPPNVFGVLLKGTPRRIGP